MCGREQRREDPGREGAKESLEQRARKKFMNDEGSKESKERGAGGRETKDEMRIDYREENSRKLIEGRKKRVKLKQEAVILKTDEI